jgi:outer membrane receptor for ferrienterochelin and colicin
MSSQPVSRLPVTPVAYAVSFALTGHYAPAALAQTPSADLDAVIVTARKREETLLDIPQEIQTLSQQQLERANLGTVEDFSRFVPSLTVNGVAPGRSAIYFRGVADDSSSFIADSSAAIYLDEQPLTQSALQPEVRLVDIERIEALPGPQGTLYGASSQSGTLRYITNKPDPTGFHADVSVDGHSVDKGDEGYEVSGVLNLPVGDNTAIRLVGFTARDAGFIDNVLGESLGGTFDNADVVEEDVNHIEYVGGRAAVRWLAGDNWTVDAGVVHQQMDANTYAEDNVVRTGGEYTNVRFLDEDREDEWTQLSLTLQGDLGWGQFTSASSYFTRDISYFQDNTDYTFYLSNAFGVYYANYDLGPDPRGLGWYDRDYADRFAQEFRLQGETERVTWIAGLFYEKLENGFDFLTRVEDYENTPSFQFWNTYYGVERFSAS